MENHTAKHFVLQLGSLISLYLSLSFFLVLTFGLINILYPAAGDNIWDVEQANGMVRIGFAMTVVFFPTYLVLTRLVNKTRRTDKQGSYLGLTKWLIYLSLLVGGLVLLGDLVAVIIAFLEGDLTQRFLLKAVAVLVTVGAAFYYYILDARGYWVTHEKRSLQYGAIGAVVIVTIMISALINIDSPAQYREYRLDDKQVSDLQTIQWQVQDYLALNGALPESLEVLESKAVPEAPEGRAAYEYRLTEQGFELCATFAAASQDEYDYYYSRPVSVPIGESVVMNPDNWWHDAGEYCFERVIETKKAESI
jgi:hypothetical protein